MVKDDTPSINCVILRTIYPGARLRTMAVNNLSLVDSLHLQLPLRMMSTASLGKEETI